MTCHVARRDRLCISILLTSMLALSGCGGGGGGGGLGNGDPTLLSITMQGVSTPLWQNIGGTPTPIPQCPNNVPLDAQIFFTFGGRVDPTSIPQGGQANGSILISTVTNGPSGPVTSVAQGLFRVEDDPALPPGNARRVVFLPSLPNSPANPNASGIISGASYTIFVPRVGNSPQVLQVGGQGLATEAVTCFVACNAQGGNNCFVDTTPGPPFVVSTTPATSDPPPAAIDPSSVTANTVSIFVSEPLNPAGINIQNVKLILSGAGFQVPGQVNFTQAGVDPALGNMSRIDYVASSALLASATYEIVITSTVVDFGGNPIEIVQGNPTAQRFFSTIAVPFCNQPPLVEDFSSTVHRDTVGLPLVWDGSGSLFTTFPDEIVGDGSAGVVVFTLAGSPHTIDTTTFTQPGVANGVWNAASVTIEPGATVVFSGAWPVHFKCLSGDFTVGANASILGSAPTPDNLLNALLGPWKGGFNNNSPTPGGQMNMVVMGGQGGVGGGQGGDASQAGFPRTDQGETGDGAFVNGLPGLDPAAPSYSPGEGGEGHAQSGNVGAGGGAGGSAYGKGGNGIPLNGINASNLCGAPLGGPVVTPASNGGFPPVFVPPISALSSGNGGGGGGDRFDLVTPTLNLDDQGGGGGGGGGGLRVSTVGSIIIGPGALIEMNGSSGNASVMFGPGAGGSGSGGMIWFQCFIDIVIDPTANLQVHGGLCPTGPSGLLDYRCAGAPGLGGEGIFQFEDGDGIIPTNFMGAAIPPAPSCGTAQQLPNQAGSHVNPGENICVLQFPFSQNISNTARSTWFDTNYGAPEYLNPGPGDEVTSLGNVPGGVVLIEYQGSPEDLINLNTPTTNPAQLSPWVTGSNLSSLTGFRFIRFRVTLGYDSPPASSASNTFPAVSFIRINFRSPTNCP